MKTTRRHKQIRTRPHKTTWISTPPPPRPPFQTLYKTQIRELKHECDQKSKQSKELQRRLADHKEER